MFNPLLRLLHTEAEKKEKEHQYVNLLAIFTLISTKIRPTVPWGKAALFPYRQKVTQMGRPLSPHLGLALAPALAWTDLTATGLWDETFYCRDWALLPQYEAVGDLVFRRDYRWPVGQAHTRHNKKTFNYHRIIKVSVDTRKWQTRYHSYTKNADALCF